jgi:hypothetical protein
MMGWRAAAALLAGGAGLANAPGLTPLDRAALPPAAATPALPVQAGAEPTPTRFAQVMVHEHIVIRIPLQPTRVPSPQTTIEWREKKGPKCLDARAIAGAALGKGSLDFVMRSGERVRARLEDSCPALDFYQGFYITPNADGKVCADRDSIRLRMGRQCDIDKFKALKPVFKH